MLSEKLKAWFDNFSQSAAIDMCEGGDDPECVAEICMDILSPRDGDGLYAELRAAIKEHGYKAVFEEVKKNVKTL